jgi:hypothetical protein
MSNACAVVNNVLNHLQDTYFPFLFIKIDESIAKKSEGSFAIPLFGNRSGDNKAGFNIKKTMQNSVLICYLNSVFISIRLIQELKKNFLIKIQNEMEDAHMNLETFDLTFNKNFQPTFFNQKMFISNLEFFTEASNHYTSLLEGKLKSMISTSDFSAVIFSSFLELISINLNIETKTYEEYEENDPYFNNFCQLINKISGQWKNQMADELFDLFMNVFIKFIAEMITEKVLIVKTNDISKYKLSLLGALYLDKLVRSIVNFFQILTQKPVRQLFEKAIEAVRVLSYETKEEVYDYLNEISNQKKLTKQEINQLIKRRDDLIN